VQTEELFSLLSTAEIFEAKLSNRPVWNEALLTSETERIRLVEEALAIPFSDTSKFAKLYSDYDFDYARVVGHEMVWFDMYIEEPVDLTPGQCKNSAKQFLAMKQNEIKVKHKYFRKITELFDGRVAKKFLAVEEYIRTMCKLKLWSDHASQATVARK
jgi:hypothetical protein